MAFQLYQGVFQCRQCFGLMKCFLVVLGGFFPMLLSGAGLREAPLTRAGMVSPLLGRIFPCYTSTKLDPQKIATMRQALPQMPFLQEEMQISKVIAHEARVHGDQMVPSDVQKMVYSYYGAPRVTLLLGNGSKATKLAHILAAMPSGQAKPVPHVVSLTYPQITLYHAQETNRFVMDGVCLTNTGQVTPEALYIGLELLHQTLQSSARTKLIWAIEEHYSYDQSPACNAHLGYLLTLFGTYFKIDTCEARKRFRRSFLIGWKCAFQTPYRWGRMVCLMQTQPAWQQFLQDMIREEEETLVVAPYDPNVPLTFGKIHRELDKLAPLPKTLVRDVCNIGFFAM